MSKFLDFDLTLDQVIEITAINAVKALGEESRCDSLHVGRKAHITAMELTKHFYTFSDGRSGEIMHGESLL